MTRNILDVTRDNKNKIFKISGKYTDDLDIKEIDNEIRISLENNELNDYLQKATPLVEQYRKIGPKDTKIDFGQRSLKVKRKDENDDVRLTIIGRYLFVAEEFIEVDVLHVVKASKNCPSCGKRFTSHEEDEVICDCGYERSVFGLNSQIASKSCYKERENFLRSVNRFCGRLEPDKEVIKELINALDEHFVSFGFSPAEDVRKRPLLKDGTRKGTTREMLIDGLLAIGRPLYEYVPSIGHHLYGWEYQNLRFVEERIMEVYDITQKAWERIPRERRSNLTTSFRLLAILKYIKYPCNRKQFKLVRTDDSFRAHIRLWKQMLEISCLSTESVDSI